MRKSLASLLAGLVLAGSAALALATNVEPAARELAPTRAKAAPAPAPVVVELFTSQGCSSCPPADKILARLAKEPGVVVISRPVTYWDRLGWKDTLASEANTSLQRAYARRGLAGSSGVYTPQAVIDGRVGVIGSREKEVRARVASAARRAKPFITVRRTGQGHEARISGPPGGQGTLSLVGYDADARVSIGRGENAGRAIAYTNVWKGERSLGGWNGGAASLAVPASARRIAGADRYALVLRQGEDGPILAARAL